MFSSVKVSGANALRRCQVELEAAASNLAEDLRNRGERPFVIPFGGSNAAIVADLAPLKVRVRPVPGMMQHHVLKGGVASMKL